MLWVDIYLFPWFIIILDSLNDVSNNDSLFDTILQHELPLVASETSNLLHQSNVETFYVAPPW